LVLGFRLRGVGVQVFRQSLTCTMRVGFLSVLAAGWKLGRRPSEQPRAEVIVASSECTRVGVVSGSSESESRYPLSLAQGRNTAGVHIISVTQHGKHRTTRTTFLFFCFTVMHYCVHVQESVCMRVLSIPAVYSAPPTLNLQEVYQYSKVYMQYLYTAYILISPCSEVSAPASEGSL
jgi:hypothetical protein